MRADKKSRFHSRNNIGELKGAVDCSRDAPRKHRYFRNRR